MNKDSLENSIGSDHSPAEEGDSLSQELEAARSEAAHNQELLARAIADLDNFRKRITREKEDLQKYRSEALVKSLLPILDNFKNGIKAVQQENATEEIIKGFCVIFEQVSEVLREQGVKEISPLGDLFDPHLHDCLSQIPSSESPEGTVIEVIRPGYMLHDRLLRPATVIISSGNPS
ncbi:MAG TPA: nucleotide exchange factor GrpE [Opitutae bacterium]|nr:nucleotide exchange factor GrpE [Opitutae bacterium]|tara:strand:- start:1536 stop:2066 length:531 start_codon:yes stop_codon:yes gene_type:complete